MAFDVAALLLRLGFGALMTAHGAQKLFGWFGGMGFAKTTAMYGGSLRLRPAWLWALLGGATEFGGGSALALGFLSPLGALSVMAAMAMATALVTRRRSFWANQGGTEATLVYFLPALALGIAGPGRYSVDALLGIRLPEPVTLLAGLVAVVAGISLALALRQAATALPAPPAATPARSA